MRTSTLLARNLAWFWRTNLAVLLGVATATAVLAGALLVGDSVRASLHDLVLSRLGSVESVVSNTNAAGAGFFREILAEELAPACPIIAVAGVAAHEPSGRRATGVQVFGVDERFWKFQGEPAPPGPTPGPTATPRPTPGPTPTRREVLLSAALAQELGSNAGDTVLLRVQKPSAIPLESLHGRKEDVGQTIRLTMTGVARHEFSLRPDQGDVRAVYVPLARLQRDLAVPDKVNTILVGHRPSFKREIDGDLKQRYRLEDLGIRLRRLETADCLSLDSDSGMISDALAGVALSTAKSLGLRAEPVLSYLANRIRIGDRATPYSLVTALDEPPAPATEDGITLNQWAARDLAAKPGDAVTLDYYVWKSDGRLDAASARFRVSQIVPIAGAAADRNLAPDYPGITASDSLYDWDPPFPLDLTRIRPTDEQYWKQYRATPKAFVRLARGRELWGTRFGSLTSIRIFPPRDGAGQFGQYEAALRQAIDPAKFGLAVLPVRAQGLEAARGATDFGEYFVYFSFFLMVSALLLTGLFFKLGVEQRMREIGVLRALGFPSSKIRLLFMLEGAVLAVGGAVAGMGAALGYCALILYGLRTWWIDAVGTRSLALHVSVPSLAYGAAAGAATGLGTIAWTLRRLQSVTPRGLVAGEQKTSPNRRKFPLATGAIPIAAALLAAALLLAAKSGKVDQTAGFFGAGTLLLIAALCLESVWLNSRGFAAIRGQISLGVRCAAYRPGRSILCIALIASTTFVIVALDAFQREASSEGAAGYPLMAESVLPLIHNPSTAAGREALNIPSLPGVEIVPFRLRAGDDASCLNLYQPRNPRILAPVAPFHPWPQLMSKPAEGAVPAIADANSLTYVLHLKLGEEFILNNARFRIVDTLQDSIFQSELLISEEDFLRLYPDVAGFRFFLLKAPPAAIPVLEEALEDYGFDIQSVAARLASFHRVENTYLATFRALGGLGLILGTIGLAAIVLRNVLERRKELALLRAVGYCPRHLAAMVLAENLLLLLLGLATGTLCALLAVAPVVATRGGHLPIISLGLLLAAVLATGIAASLAATAASLRSPLIAALRSE
jgi:ABC-type lipoprotein release transport system permease subunit